MSGLDHQPPPLFKQGPAPLALLILYVCTSVSLLVLDDRFRYLEPVRLFLTQATAPLKQAVQWPVLALTSVDEYAVTLEGAGRRHAHGHHHRHAGTVAQLAESYLELLEIIDEMNPCPPGECLHPSCQRAAKALIDSGVREWNERPPNTAN